MSQHPPLPDDYFENREVVIKTENEEIQPTPPKVIWNVKFSVCEKFWTASSSFPLMKSLFPQVE